MLSSAIERLLDLVRPAGKQEVLVIVNTTKGPVAVGADSVADLLR